MSEKKSIYAKLLAVKKQIPYLKKDTKGFNYEYVSPEQLLKTINPLLNEQGLILKTEVINQCHETLHTKDAVKKYWLNKENVEYVHPVNEVLYHLTLKMTWVDIETGETDENLFRSSGMNNEEQGVGSAITYGSRYFMMSYFNIPNGADDPDSIQSKKQEASVQKEPKKEESKTLTESRFKTALKNLSIPEKKEATLASLRKYSLTPNQIKQVQEAK